ncbi:MAG TPA: YihY/virulence factor BrkB family protein [Candidatus Binataceae bacterium]|nr:YihY/virulence factor BrkB family protein [Candidatus Binataceae bacterium]
MSNHHPHGWIETAALRVETRAQTYPFVFKPWRIIAGAIENFFENDDMLRASALTYTSALSIVPILALAFSALKGFGASDQLSPLVERYLALGSTDTSHELMHFVENVNAAALGTAGAAFLLVTVISTLGNIERAFNGIFRVPRSRSYLRRFSDYLSVLFTVPILIAAALAFTTMVEVRVPLSPIIARVAPYLFVWAGFFFLFIFFPYTKVRWGPALLGSFVSAVLFQFAQWGYVKAQVYLSSYRAIYGALATLPIFLVWTYIAWALILFGAEVTAAAQRGTDTSVLRPNSPDFPCSATLHILLQLATQQFLGGSGPTLPDLAHGMGLGISAIEPIVERLKDDGLIVEATSDHGGHGHGGSLHLIRAPASVRIADVIRTLIEDDPADPGNSSVAQVMRQIAAAQVAAVGDTTLADLFDHRDPQHPLPAHTELKPAS